MINSFKTNSILYILLIGFLSLSSLAVKADTPKEERQSLGKPDLVAIKAAVTDEASPRYYPKLLKQFMSNDTVMTAEDYQYFYYGTMFQEDYNPYRDVVDPEEFEELAPLYSKEKTSRIERQRMLEYSMRVLADNPLNLKQLTNRVYVYEKNRKFDLAKIWQYKLNHLLLVIAASGDGMSIETALMVVYPGNEYEYINLMGHTAVRQQFVAPHYDFITINKKNNSDPEVYYFDVKEMLNQYFAKHTAEE